MSELFELSKAGSVSSSKHHSAWRWTLILIVCNGLLWFFLYSYYRHGLDNADMVEAYAWGHTWDWGNNKHPPMTGWVTNLWFSLFPTSDASFYLLTEFNLAIALFFLASAMRRFMNDDQIFIAIVLTVVFSRYGIDTGYKYNANSGQLPFITGFLCCCLNAFINTKRISLWWVAAGFFAAAAILCKYSALLVLTACVIAAILVLKPTRNKILIGATVTSLLALLLLIPHIIWEIQHQWPSIQYMHASHQFSQADNEGNELWHAMVESLQFSAVSVVFWLAAMFNSQSGKKQSQHKRIGAVIYLLSLFLTIFAAWIEHITVEATWFIVPSIFLGWFLVDMMPRQLDGQKACVRLRILFGLYALVLILSAICLERRYESYPAPAAYALQQRLADDITKLYQTNYHSKIQNVAGSFPLPYAMSFYSPDHPQGMYDISLKQSPWITPRQLSTESKVVICSFQKNDGCIAKARQLFGSPANHMILDYVIYDPHHRQRKIEQFTVLMYPTTQGPIKKLVSRQKRDSVHLKISG